MIFRCGHHLSEASGAVGIRRRLQYNDEYNNEGAVIQNIALPFDESPQVADVGRALSGFSPILESIETFEGFFSKLLEKPIQWEDGFVIPSNEPGLGVALNESVCDANPYTRDDVFPPMAEVPLATYKP